MDDSSQKCRHQIKIIITNVKALQKRLNIYCKLLSFFLLKINLGFISDFCSMTSFIFIPSLSVFVRIVHHLRQGCYCSQRCFKSKIEQNALRFQNFIKEVQRTYCTISPTKSTLANIFNIIQELVRRTCLRFLSKIIFPILTFTTLQ